MDAVNDRREMRLKLVITEDIAGGPVERLRKYADIERCDHDPSTLRTAAHDADLLLVRTATQVDRELLDACPKLRGIGRYGVGLDNFDLQACAERGIDVYNSAGMNARAVAEMTMLMILQLARGSSFDPTHYDAWARDAATGRELHSCTLGLVGLGAIGREVAARAQAFGLRVLAHDPYLPAHAWGSVTPMALDEMLPNVDILSLHVPATAETRGMVDDALLAKLPEGAWLVNTARGALVDEEALLRALDSGRIAKAALDVRRDEPPVAPDPFRDRPEVLLSPHVAGFTEVSLDRVLARVCEQLETKAQQLTASRAVRIPGR